MNQSKYWFPIMRCGKRINDGQAINALVGAFYEHFEIVILELVQTMWQAHGQYQQENKFLRTKIFASDF